MAAIAAAAIAGGVGLIGDLFSSSGTQQTNAANLQIAQMNNQFNAQQAQLNRQFQEGQVSQMEDYQTMMSDTAMTRRVNDLKNAGLNPLLAISQGGASTPGGGMGSGSAASASGNPTMQNPNAAFANAGQQASQALQLYQQQASIKLANAQAAKVTSETPSSDYAPKMDPDTGELVVPGGQGHELGDATVAQIKAVTGQATAQAVQIQTQVKYIDSQIRNTDQDTALKNIQTALVGANAEVAKGTAQLLIRQAQQATDQGDTTTWLRTGTLGKVLGILNAITGPVASFGGGTIIGRALGGGGAKAAQPNVPFGNTPIPQLSTMP